MWVIHQVPARGSLLPLAPGPGLPSVSVFSQRFSVVWRTSRGQDGAARRERPAHRPDDGERWCVDPLNPPQIPDATAWQRAPAPRLQLLLSSRKRGPY